MKILPISDIHGRPEVLEYISDEIDPKSYDLITCSGDVWEGSSISKKYEWDSLQKKIKKPIIMIQGNHDFWLPSIFNRFKNIHLLHNSSMTLDHVKFFGTPNTVNFMNWNHMMDEDELFKLWDSKIPEGVDVLISHGPPYGYGDNCNMPVYGNTSESKLGSKALLAILEDRAPKYCIFGHIHSGDRFTVMPNGTKCLNVSCLDEHYRFGGFNPYPQVLELELD